MKKDPILMEDEERQKAYFAEVDAISKRYGYDHYFLVAGEHVDGKSHAWIGNLQEPWYEGTLNAVEEWVDILREKYGFERGEIESYE